MWLSRYGATYKAILKLGLPLIVGQLGLIITAFADTIMVGHYSTEALASASFVNNLFNTPMMAIMGFTYGLTPLVGALFGSGNLERIGCVLKNGFVVSGIFAAIVIGIMLWFYFNLDVLAPPAELLPLIRPYYLLYMAGLVPVALFGIFLQWSYAINLTVFPTLLLLGANAFNIVGNYALIYGHLGFQESGLTGAGISTLIARTIPLAVMAVVFMLRRDWAVFREGFSNSSVTFHEMKGVNSTSWPVALQLALESGSFTLAAVMAGRFGKIPLASFQVIVVTGMLGFCVYYSIGNAIAIMVSNDRGRGDTAAMRRDAMGGYHIMLVFMTAASVLFLFFGKNIMALFTDDSAVLAASVALIFPLILYQLGDATQITFSNALRGTSRVMPMLLIAFEAYVVIGIPAMYLLGFTARLGVYGIVLSFSVSLFTAAGLFLYFFLDTLKRNEFILRKE
ncbi:MAG: MATE family efflux transporter [Duncaniella sp.]|nr:MATE family efflux transporter [Duncaniella sp.]